MIVRRKNKNNYVYATNYAINGGTNGISGTGHPRFGYDCRGL